MAAFDPYHRWLGIPPAEQPPDHYRLLGLVRYESNLDVIENAANQRMAHLRSFQSGQNASLSQRLLNEVAAARVCLLNPEQKASYDVALRETETPPAVSTSPPITPPAPIVPQPPPAASLSSPKIEIETEESWVSSHLHGHRDHDTTPRVSRGVLIALGGSVAALVLLIAIALLRRGDSILVLDLGDVHRADIRFSIDGADQPLPPSGPLEFPCEPGSHEVVASRPGHSPFVREVTLGSRERLTIVPGWGQPTQLVLAWPEADRDGGKLFLDGRPQDLSPLETANSEAITLPVEPGSRIVRIERPGFEPFEKAIVALLGESIEVVPAFARESGVPPSENAAAVTPSATAQDPASSQPEMAQPGVKPSDPPAGELPGRLARWRAFQEALARLETQPDDPTANALACHWHLVDADRPEEAFPYMAKMQHQALSPLAVSELTPPGSAENQAALGDRWWDQAEAASDPLLEDAFRERALHWYTRARPNLSSVALVERIASRLGETAPPRAPTPGPATEKPAAAFSLPDGPAVPKGDWIDLLAVVDLSRDVVRGLWRRQGPVVSSAAARSALMLPVAVYGDYELEVRFSQVNGLPQGFNIVLPVGSHACSVFLPHTMRDNGGAITRHNMRNDVLSNVNGQPYIASVPRLEAGRGTTTSIRVTTQDAQKLIAVVVNGSPYLQWQGKESSLACSSLGSMPRMNQPGLANDQDQYAVQAIRFRLLQGEARRISGTTLPPRPYLLTGDVGGYQGTVFEDLAADGSVLVGLRTVPGGLGLMGLQPVYRDETGSLHDGTWVGSPARPTSSIIAKEGYAVGALAFETQNQRLTGVIVRFYRLGNDGLDLADTYDSPLIGEGGIDGLSVVETRGRPAIGTHGLWNPGQIVSLGLAFPRPAEEKLWTASDDGRRRYVSLLDLEPIQCTVAEMTHSRRLGIGACDPDFWPIVDSDSQFCPEFLYAPAPSRLIWRLPSTAKSLSAIGYCVESRTVRFCVLVDGQMVYGGEQAGVAEIKVDLPPGNELELQVDDMGNATGDESFWLYPRVHSRPADQVTEFDGKDARGKKLVDMRHVSPAMGQRSKSHKPLRPLYPVRSHCREFLYAHPPSRVVYSVPSGAKRFTAIGYCVASKTVRFRVAVNGKELYQSGPAGIEAIQVSLPRQAKTIELWIDPTSDSRTPTTDQAFWCFPRFY